MFFYFICTGVFRHRYVAALDFDDFVIVFSALHLAAKIYCINFFYFNVKFIIHLLH